MRNKTRGQLTARIKEYNVVKTEKFDESLKGVPLEDVSSGEELSKSQQTLVFSDEETIPSPPPKPKSTTLINAPTDSDEEDEPKKPAPKAKKVVKGSGKSKKKPDAPGLPMMPESQIKNVKVKAEKAHEPVADLIEEKAPLLQDAQQDASPEKHETDDGLNNVSLPSVEHKAITLGVEPIAGAEQSRPPPDGTPPKGTRPMLHWSPRRIMTHPSQDPPSEQQQGIPVQHSADDEQNIPEDPPPPPYSGTGEDLTTNLAPVRDAPQPSPGIGGSNFKALETEGKIRSQKGVDRLKNEIKCFRFTYKELIKTVKFKQLGEISLVKKAQVRVSCETVAKNTRRLYGRS